MSPAARFFVAFMAAMQSAGIVLQAKLPQDRSSPAKEKLFFDVVVVGATPAGIAAALGAARLGSQVALVERSAHLGGQFADGGLCYTDIWIRRTEPRIFDEFSEGVRRHYKPDLHLSPKEVREQHPFQYGYAGYFWEPSVAEKVLTQMVESERLITVLRQHQLLSVSRKGRQVVGATFEIEHGSKELSASVFIDATYEGDLAAMAGAEYRFGREGRSEYNEQHAGVIYQDIVTKTIYSGSTGGKDNRLPSYTVQLVVTNNTANRVAIDRPQGYDRNRYVSILQDLKSGLVKGIGDIYSFVPAGPLSGVTSSGPLSETKKYCLNNTFKGSISADLPGENTDYPDGDTNIRRGIYEKHLNHTLGLMYFLQNDREVPDSLRQEANQWGLAGDEYTDHHHVPRDIYVREARRIYGEVTLTENDLRTDSQNSLEPDSPVQIEPPLMFPLYPRNLKAIGNQRPPVHDDSIAVAGYFSESRAARAWEPGHEEDRHVFEGVVFLDRLGLPAQLPYGIMVPKTVDGLLVPVAVSATHIAFSAIRMEPTWMALGEAAGVAAHIAASQHVSPRRVDVEDLQQILIERGQKITFFNDVPSDHPNFQALQYFGAKGFFLNFTAWPDKPVTQARAITWLSRIRKIPDADLKLLIAGSSPGAFTAEAELTRKVVLDWLGRIFPGNHDVFSRAVPSGEADAPVTRAEFCQLLYGQAKAKRTAVEK